MNIQFPRFTFVEDAKASIRNLVSVGNDIVSLLQDKLQRTPTVEVVVMDVSVSDRPFIVPHNLGTTPKFALGYGSVNAHTYTTTDDEREWNAQSIKLRYPSTGRVRIMVAA